MLKSSASDLNESGETQMLKLPALEFPKFDCKLHKWVTFKADFTDFIADDRIKHSNFAKRRYFHHALHGDVKRLVENLRECSFAKSWLIITMTHIGKRICISLICLNPATI